MFSYIFLLFTYEYMEIYILKILKNGQDLRFTRQKLKGRLDPKEVKKHGKFLVSEDMC